MYWAKDLVLFLPSWYWSFAYYYYMMIFVSFFKVELTQLGKIFNTIVEVFLFLDKNGDGKLNKKDVDKTLNDTYPWERSPANITRIRFSIYLLHFVNIVFMFFFSFFLSCFIICFKFLVLSVIFCRRNGLGRKWASHFQGVPLWFLKMGWDWWGWTESSNRRSSCRDRWLTDVRLC